MPNKPKRCINCDKEMPAGAVKAGWTIVEMRVGGRRHYYRMCGCLTWRAFSLIMHHLLDHDVDYVEEIADADEERS